MHPPRLGGLAVLAGVIVGVVPALKATGATKEKLEAAVDKLRGGEKVQDENAEDQRQAIALLRQLYQAGIAQRNRTLRTVESQHMAYFQAVTGAAVDRVLNGRG